jgi:23S rRNA pseudouridine2605 synthase
MNKKGRKGNSGDQKPERKEYGRKSGKPGFRKRKAITKPLKTDNLTRLNKYLADAGICSRREADRLIESGVVKINGKVITQLGTKVAPTDKVQYGGQTLRRETLRYLLLNKPKGFITTVDDPQNRRTVMALVENACKERIYPVGRLDRNTLGLLLFTNDGEMTKKLTHPKFGVKKIYHVFLDKNLKKQDLDQIANGIQLEDGFIKPDVIAYSTRDNDKKQIGIELHSGRNRIVRRVFESLGYNVIKLDRVFFAGLTKKDLPRGKWRMLEESEVNLLKRLG